MFVRAFRRSHSSNSKKESHDDGEIDDTLSVKSHSTVQDSRNKCLEPKIFEYLGSEDEKEQLRKLLKGVHTTRFNSKGQTSRVVLKLTSDGKFIQYTPLNLWSWKDPESRRLACARLAGARRGVDPDPAYPGWGGHPGLRALAPRLSPVAADRALSVLAPARAGAGGGEEDAWHFVFDGQPQCVGACRALNALVAAAARRTAAARARRRAAEQAAQAKERARRRAYRAARRAARGDGAPGGRCLYERRRAAEGPKGNEGEEAATDGGGEDGGGGGGGGGKGKGQGEDGGGGGGGGRAPAWGSRGVCRCDACVSEQRWRRRSYSSRGSRARGPEGERGGGGGGAGGEEEGRAAPRGIGGPASLEGAGGDGRRAGLIDEMLGAFGWIRGSGGGAAEPALDGGGAEPKKEKEEERGGGIWAFFQSPLEK